MIGLTSYERDLGLPGKLGDERLDLPSESALVDLVNRRLSTGPGGLAAPDAAMEASVVHARYKPGVAAAATYSVTFADGAERAVTYKAHLGGKAEERVIGGKYADALSELVAPLRPIAFMPDQDASLAVFPADPELRGAIRALEKRRVARWIDQLGIASPWVFRLRASSITLRRYKYSRRAVFHIEAKFRRDEGERSAREFGLRVLSVGEAERSAACRSALAGLDVALPRMLGHDPQAGWILEEWLPGTACRRTDFSRTSEAMACAAQLHSIPRSRALEAWRPASGLVHRSAPLGTLERAMGAGAMRIRSRSPLAVPADRWVHGDLHPDQVMVHASGVSLLDMDNLRPGAPEEDLASWAADALTLGDADDPRGAAQEVLEPYVAACGLQVSEPLLRALLALELLQRAAASVRRLEVGAVDKAKALVVLADQLDGGAA